MPPTSFAAPCAWCCRRWWDWQVPPRQRESTSKKASPALGRGQLVATIAQRKSSTKRTALCHGPLTKKLTCGFRQHVVAHPAQRISPTPTFWLQGCPHLELVRRGFVEAHQPTPPRVLQQRAEQDIKPSLATGESCNRKGLRCEGNTIKHVVLQRRKEIWLSQRELACSERAPLTCSNG